MTTVALYARVSTKDKGQSTENQLPELRRFAQAHDYNVYKEQESAFCYCKRLGYIFCSNASAISRRPPHGRAISRLTYMSSEITLGPLTGWILGRAARR